jgi:hypothetical protein
MYKGWSKRLIVGQLFCILLIKNVGSPEEGKAFYQCELARYFIIGN